MSASDLGSKTGTAQIGVTGLAVMGSNLARNFARHGYTVGPAQPVVAKTDALLKEHGDEGKFVPAGDHRRIPGRAREARAA